MLVGFFVARRLTRSLRSLVRLARLARLAHSNSPPRIPTRRPNHRQPLPLPALLPSIPPFQTILKHVAQKLQRDILERKRRPMPQLQHKLPLPDFTQRGRLLVPERGIGPIDNLLQIRMGDR